jgi:hypothetical protein
MKKRTVARIMAAVMAVSMLAGCGGSDGDTAKKVNLDPDHPVSLKIWHYYNGTQQAIFDDLVDEFNATKGKNEGISVQAGEHRKV